MKRSEFITQLGDFLRVYEQGSDYEDAESILNKILDLGMKPPEAKEPCETFVLHNGRYVQTENSFIFTHKWDEE